MSRWTATLAAALLTVSSCCPVGQPPPAAPVPPPTPPTASGDTAEPTSSIDANRPRADIPAQYRWNPSPLFADDAAFAQGLAEAARKREELGRCTGVARDPARLRACLDLYLETRLLTNKLTLYASMERATNTTSSDVQARVDSSRRP